MQIEHFNATRVAIIKNEEAILNEKMRMLNQMNEKIERHLETIKGFRVQPEVKKPFIEKATQIAKVVAGDKFKLERRIHTLEAFKKLDAEGVSFNSLKLTDGCVISGVQSALFGVTNTFRPVYLSVAETAEGTYLFAVVDTIATPVVLNAVRVAGTREQIHESVDAMITLIGRVSIATFDTLSNHWAD